MLSIGWLYFETFRGYSQFFIYKTIKNPHSDLDLESCILVIAIFGRRQNF